VTERDYQARMNRLTRLAFHMDDEAAANEAIALAGRAGDHATGRRLLARFDREGVAAAIGAVPTEPDVRYRGVRLFWSESAPFLYAACAAAHVLPYFEDAYPDDLRPRAAIEAIRAFELGRQPMPARALGTDAMVASIGIMEPEARLEVTGGSRAAIGEQAAARYAAESAAAAIYVYHGAKPFGDVLSAAREAAGWAPTYQIPEPSRAQKESQEGAWQRDLMLHLLLEGMHKLTLCVIPEHE